MLYLSIRLFALANSNALLRLTSGLDVGPWLQRKAASEEHTVNSPSNRDAALALWPPSARADNWNHRERPRWRRRSALQRVNPTGSCTFCLMFVFFFDVWPPCSPWKQTCNRSALRIHVYLQSKRAVKCVRTLSPPHAVQRMHAPSLLSTSSSSRTECRREESPLKAKRQIAHLDVLRQLIGGSTVFFFGCYFSWKKWKGEITVVSRPCERGHLREETIPMGLSLASSQAQSFKWRTESLSWTSGWYF